ncbi:hypothetical protein RQP46_002338 [Phenoliferia psychrophenolica]
MAPEVAKKGNVIQAAAGQSQAHFSLDVKFPCYAIEFLGDRLIVLAGGGGSSKTGIANRLSTYKIDVTGRSFELVEQHDLSKEEDAPMSLAVNPQARPRHRQLPVIRAKQTAHVQTKAIIAGINSSSAELAKGTNNNLRLFEYSDDGITFKSAQQTITSTNEDHYQKVTAFSRSTPTLVAIGSTNAQLSLLSYPSLEDVFPPIMYDEGDEIYDTDFNDDGDMVIATSSKKLVVWSTKAGKDGKHAEPVQTIERPVLKKELACTFRAGKFGRKTTKANIYTVVNAAPAVRSRKAGPGEKKSFVSMWDTKTWKLVKTRVVSQRPLTAFDISLDGTLLAFGSSDLSVGVLDAVNLRSIMTILKAHDFPVTALRFNPTADLVVSGSADNSVRVISIPPVEARGANSMAWNVFLTLLILIIAILVQQSIGDDVMKVARETLHF